MLKNYAADLYFDPFGNELRSCLRRKEREKKRFFFYYYLVEY